MDPLASVGELENHLQRAVDQGQGEQSLTLASGAVRAYCGWDLARETTTLYTDSDGGPVVSLPTMLLLSVTAIRVNGVTVDMAGSYPPRWTRKGQIFWLPGWANCQVEADVTHGYDPMPDLIKLVVLDLAACKQTNPQGLVSATVGQVSTTWGSTSAGSDEYGLSALHARLLDRYRLFS